MRNYAVLLSLFLFTSCSNVFEFSPYAAKVNKQDRSQTIENMNQLILDETQSSDSFSFMLIADSHYYFDDLKASIEKINSLANCDFVVHLGDMADHGLLKEYEMFSEYMNLLDVPFLTCIGNHDYLSNGSLIYKSMFGELNRSLIYKNRKLIFFDATTFESNKQPDMLWFSDQLESDNLPKLIFSHIPPWDDHYSNENTAFYKSLLNNNVILSMHGHHHNFYYGNKLETEVNFLVVPESKKRQMIRVSIKADNSYSFEIIDF